MFLLAEWEERDLHVAASDASYAWSWTEAMHRVASGKSVFDALVNAQNEGAYHRDAMRMTFVSSHDRTPARELSSSSSAKAHFSRAHRALLRSRGIIAVIPEPADQ